MGAPRTLIIDGWEAADGGVVVTGGLQGKGDGPRRSYPHVRVPGKMAAVRVTAEPEFDNRELKIPVAVVGTDRADLLAKIDELKWRLGDGELNVVFVDDEARQFRARSAEMKSRPIRPELTQRAERFDLEFLMLDPRIYDATETSVALSTTAADTPLETAPVGPVVQVDGDVTDPSLIYRDSGGTEQARMDLTVTLAAGEFLEIDMEERTIVDDTGAARPEVLTGGNFFRLDPRDGDPTSDVYPTLELSAGSGTATYFRAYW